MPSPFPGMDPYLEDPARWPGVHTWIITSLAQALGPRLRPRYYLSVEERVYVAGETDAPSLALVGVADALVASRWRSGNGDGWSAAGEEIRPAAPVRAGVLVVEVPRAEQARQRYLEVREAGTHLVVTVVEVLSPADKRPGEGRQQYQAKRLAVLSTATNLIEIDFLRAGEPLPVLYQGRLLPGGPADYRVLVSRGEERPRALLYTASLRERLPVIPIPLRPGEEAPEVDLQEIVNTVYERGSYDLRIDYRSAPVPPLRLEDASWAGALIQAAHGR